MSLSYPSGEEIQPGDRILYHGEPGQVEFLATPGDAETAWYAGQFGGGCMIVAQGFGRIFLSKPGEEEDLAFVSRGQPPVSPGT